MGASISRFVRPSSGLELRALLRGTRRAVAWALAAALAVHLSVTRVGGPAAERGTAKPLTTQFVKRAPRLTKPLELKKRPRPKRRLLERKMVSVRARSHGQSGITSSDPSQAVGSLIRPAIQTSRTVSLGEPGVEPLALAGAIEGSKEPQNRIEMTLDMVDIDALDTGEYHAMVIQDPRDKKNIKGFFHLAIAYPGSMRLRAYHSSEDRVISGIIRLAEKMNEWTSIRTDVTKRLTFDSAELFSTPWVHLAIHFTLEPTEEECSRLGQYMVRGGFFFGEGTHVMSVPPQHGYEALMSFIESGLASQGLELGRHWLHEVLPSTHALFHCYYDFEGGPPPGGALISRFMWGYTITHPDGMAPVVRGISFGDRLAGITTNQMYGLCWGDWGRIAIGGRDYYKNLDATRVLQLGINSVIFALTQEGSITHRLMESVE